MTSKFDDSDIAEMQQGISTFILQWMMLEATRNPDPSSVVLNWVRHLCDSIEQGMEMETESPIDTTIEDTND